MSQKRRNYFIDKNFQSRFILKFCTIVIISSLVVSGLLLYVGRDSTTVAIENTEVVVKNTADFILPVLIQTMIVVFIFSAAAVMILTLLVSHKISGPLFRLKREIDYLSGGDFRRNFNIRGNDQLKNFARGLEDMCTSLRLRHLTLKDRLTELKEYLEQKDYFIGEGDRESFKEKLVSLEREIGNFNI
ncbi:MAG: HAMP domain-containing protein [Candidatus Omnitrophica bacterium]|nr:HAMP domain-containing protein [Candidatus Omnitrophota bacterium]